MVAAACTTTAVDNDVTYFGSSSAYFVRTRSQTKRAARFVKKARVTRLHKTCSMFFFILHHKEWK
jgi:hypothetical protein